MIKNAIINKIIGNSNVSSLGTGRQKNIIEVANKRQVDDALKLLLPVLTWLS